MDSCSRQPEMSLVPFSQNRWLVVVTNLSAECLFAGLQLDSSLE